MHRYLSIAAFGADKLEREFRRDGQQTFSIALRGDGLGRVRYSTGYADEPGDPLGWIHQRIRTLSFEATLGEAGLELAAEGELYDFDAAEIALHRERRNSRLKPVDGFAVSTTMPWALLVARSFSFAYRMKDF